MLRSDANRTAATALQDAYEQLSSAVCRLRAVQTLVEGPDADALSYALDCMDRARTRIESMRVIETTNTEWGV